jgi:2-polyprenyl-6-methoxyphenol hydroxylase-like FAD-dependent oxidoreductase
VRRVQLIDARGGQIGGFSTDALRQVTKGRFISLPRGELAGAITAAVAGRAEMIFGDSITAIDDHAHGVRLAFENSPSREFDLVVGADGLHSNVRRLVFGPESQFERRLGYYVAAFETSGYRPRDNLTYVAYGVPGRQVARFALRGDRTMFLFVFTDDRMAGPEPHDLEGFKAALRQTFGNEGWECDAILRTLDSASEVYFDRVSQIEMDVWSKGRVVLVGDAAACASLLAGEGSGLAMTEAYVLADELRAVGGDHRQAFARCEQRLRPFIDGKQAAARRFASSFAPRTAFGIWVRAQAFRLMAIPGVAGLLIGRDLRDDFELPDAPA